MIAHTNPINGRRVLLVEDDYFIAASMRDAFERSGARVLGPVATVADALTIIAATPGIDAAVLDVHLQDEMVFPVADALRARGVPFLFATGYEPSMIPQRFADVHHCEKPVEPLKFVQSLLGQPSPDAQP